MIQLALLLLCSAQLLHFTRHWVALSRMLYAGHCDRRLKDHLDWSRAGEGALPGDPRPGSALRRTA